MRYPGPLMASAVVVFSIPAIAQNEPLPPKPDHATYITREEIEAVEKAEPIGDRTVKVVHIGYENFAVGVVHRGKTINGRTEQRASLKLPPPKPCGRQIKAPPMEKAYPGGITHDSQAEGYFITSGEGTMFTDGYIVDGANYDLAELNGPTCLGPAYSVTLKKVKVGDVIVIPAGVVHGWIDVPDHVDYVSFRPSRGILQAGWMHPAIRK